MLSFVPAPFVQLAKLAKAFGPRVGRRLGQWLQTSRSHSIKRDSCGQCTGKGRERNYHSTKKHGQCIWCDILWNIVIYFFSVYHTTRICCKQLVLSSLCFCFDFIPQDPLDQDQTGAGPCIASWALGGHGAAERCLYLPSSRFQTESFGDCSICWIEADEWAWAKSYVCCGWPTSQQGFFWTSLPNTSETWPGSGCFGQPPPDTTLCSCAWRQWNLRRLADCTGVRSRPCWFQRRDTPLHCLPKLTDGNGHEALEAWSFFGCERHVWRSSATVFCQSYFSKSLHGEAGRNPRDDELAKEAKARASRRSAPLEAVQRGLILAVHRPQCDDSMGISRWGCSRWENSRGKVQRDPGREWWLHRHRPATRSNSKDPCSGAGICFGSCGLSPRAPHAPGYGTWRMGRLFWSPCERGWCPQIDLQFIEKGFRYAVAHLLCREEQWMHSRLPPSWLFQWSDLGPRLLEGRLPKTLKTKHTKPRTHMGPHFGSWRSWSALFAMFILFWVHNWLLIFLLIPHIPRRPRVQMLAPCWNKLPQ